MRKHPFAFGVLLLFCLGLIFFLFIDRCSLVSGNMKPLSLKDRVGVITISEIITDSEDIVSRIQNFADDEAIKAVVLRIDSPGGAVAPAQEISSAVLDLKKKKKVVTSMGSICASGGYLIACAADKIVANPGSITGSISAIMHFVNTEELLKKIGLKADVVKSGKFKDIGSPVREMTQEEKAIMQGLVDDIYDQFLDTVSKDRKIPKEELKNMADGRVFSGRQAQKLGLVDYIGDMNYAVNLAGKLAGIKGKPDLAYPPEKKLDFWDYMLQSAATKVIATMTEKQEKLNGIMYLYDYGNPLR